MHHFYLQQLPSSGLTTSNPPRRAAFSASSSSRRFSSPCAAAAARRILRIGPPALPATQLPHLGTVQAGGPATPAPPRLWIRALGGSKWSCRRHDAPLAPQRAAGCCTAPAGVRDTTRPCSGHRTVRWTDRRCPVQTVCWQRYSVRHEPFGRLGRASSRRASAAVCVPGRRPFDLRALYRLTVHEALIAGGLA